MYGVRFCLTSKIGKVMKKFCKKLVLFLTMYILLGLSSMIAIQCSLICLPVSMIIGGVGYDECGIIMSAFVEDLQPIPITAEVLEKNGFVKWQGGLVLIGDDISCRYEDDNLTIEQGSRDNDGVLIERLLVNIECKSVHQLQHALRFAGVGKEIVL